MFARSQSQFNFTSLVGNGCLWLLSDDLERELCACGALCKTGRSFHSSVSQQHSAVLSVKREASRNLHVIAHELSGVRPSSTYCSVSCCSPLESLSHTGGGLPRLPPSPVLLFHMKKQKTKKHHRFLFVCLVFADSLWQKLVIHLSRRRNQRCWNPQHRTAPTRPQRICVVQTVENCF